MGEKYYKISELDLRELIKSDLKLCILERDGVDNWAWYMAGLTDFLAENLNKTKDEVLKRGYEIDDLVEETLQGYDIIE